MDPPPVEGSVRTRRSAARLMHGKVGEMGFAGRAFNGDCRKWHLTQTERCIVYTYLDVGDARMCTVDACNLM
eukprot:1605156-Pyramimonas_sp.AAC.3